MGLPEYERWRALIGQFSQGIDEIGHLRGRGLDFLVDFALVQF